MLGNSLMLSRFLEKQGVESKVMNKQREAFEDWITKEGGVGNRFLIPSAEAYLSRFSNGHPTHPNQYRCREMHMPWEAWQEAQKQITQKVYEVRDVTNEDMYHQCGMFLDFDDAKQKILSYGNDDQITDDPDGFEKVAIVAHEVGSWQKEGVEVFSITRDRIWDAEMNYHWETVKTYTHPDYVGAES